jgi:predicted dehydrogenase/threonine dehydrogenase-like Zn-dependent dehydrogenase
VPISFKEYPLQQVVQSIRTGRLKLENVPEPVARPGQLLIANQASVISAGTEKIVMELARKSLLGKALERPDQVRRVLEKLRNEGILNTISQVRAKLDEPMTMGYSSTGVVLACGAGVQGFKPGDRVASNGPHGEVVCVPKNLCAAVPEGVPPEHAAFGVLGAIALQGVRLSKAALGETVLVIGLGLIGQITVALLKAAGVRVLGMDLDAAKCQLAVDKMGASVASPEISPGQILDLTRGLGADAVLITASTKSRSPMDFACQAVRAKGRIVLVGVIGLELDRRPFYFKEIEFVVSCSYGPGRYDPSYEEHGHDYPPAYVRWTEQRNIQAVLDLMGNGGLDVSPLITHRFPIEKAEEAYELIESAKEPYLGVVLTYPEVASGSRKQRIELGSRGLKQNGPVRVGCLGSGNYARTVLLPLIRRNSDFDLRMLCSAGGLSAAHTGSKHGFTVATTDEEEVFKSPDVDIVFVLTRHDQHARQVIRAIESRKNVFVEKPLALTLEEIKEIEDALASAPEPKPLLMVGFNRRFSPAARSIRNFFGDVHAPLTISIRFNPGKIEAEHWIQDETVGGGRIIGEACHAIDLATFLAGSQPVRVYAESVGGLSAPNISDDQCFITLRHSNGSISNVGYLAGGDKAFPKERVEVFGGGKVAVVDDFREVLTCTNGKLKRQKYRSQDKGYQAEMEALAKAVLKGEQPSMSWEEIRSVTLASILAVQSLREGLPFSVP